MLGPVSPCREKVAITKEKKEASSSYTYSEEEEQAWFEGKW